MTTDKKTNYDRDEEKLINLVEHMREHYNINLKDIEAILWDRLG